MLMDKPPNYLCLFCTEKKSPNELTNIFKKPALLRSAEKAYGVNIIYDKNLPENICLQCILRVNVMLDDRRRSGLVNKEPQNDFVIQNNNNNNKKCINKNDNELSATESVESEDELDELIYKTSNNFPKINNKVNSRVPCESERMRETEVRPVKEHLLRHRRRNTICVEPKPKKARKTISVAPCPPTNESPISKRKNLMNKEDLIASELTSYEENNSVSIIAKRGHSKEQLENSSKPLSGDEAPVKNIKTSKNVKKATSVASRKSKTARRNKLKEIPCQEVIETIDDNLDKNESIEPKTYDVPEATQDDQNYDTNGGGDTVDGDTGAGDGSGGDGSGGDCYSDRDSKKSNIVFEPMFCRTENVLDTESGGNIDKLNDKNTMRTEKLYSTTHNCQFCRKSYVKYVTLEKHLKKFHRRRNNASSVHTTITDSSNLTQQTKITKANSASTWGIGLLEYKCNFCPEEFSTRRRLNTHLKTHREMITCPTCNEAKFPSPNDLEWHQTICQAKNEAKCELNNEVSDQKITKRVTRSRSVANTKKISYSEVEDENDDDDDDDAESEYTTVSAAASMYRKRMDNIEHWVDAGERRSSIVSEENEDLRSVASDLSVNTNFTSATGIINKLRNGERTINPKYYDDYDDDSSIISTASDTTGTTGTRYFKRVVKQYHKYKHTYNRREYRRVSKRRRRLRRKTKTIAMFGYGRLRDEDMIIVCLICLKKFDHLKDLMHHEVYEHPGFGFIPYYRCLQCGVRYTQDLYLCRHSYEHLASGPHCCIYCYAEFSVKMDLKLHIELHHIKSYKCIYCDMSYLRNDDLYIHLTEYHNYRNENINFNDKNDKRKFINIINEFNKMTNTILIRNNHIKVKKKDLTEENTKKNAETRTKYKIYIRIQNKDKNLINNNYYNYNQKVINLCNLSDDRSGRDGSVNRGGNRRTLKIRRKCYNNYTLKYGQNISEVKRNIVNEGNGNGNVNGNGNLRNEITDYIYNGINSRKNVNKETILLRNGTGKCISPEPVNSEDNKNDNDIEENENQEDAAKEIEKDSDQNVNVVDVSVTNEISNGQVDEKIVEVGYVEDEEEEEEIEEEADNGGGGVIVDADENKINDNDEMIIDEDDDADSLINSEFLQEADNNINKNKSLSISDYNLFSINDLDDGDECTLNASSTYIGKNRKRHISRSPIIKTIKRRVVTNNKHNYNTSGQTCYNKINLYNYKKVSKHLLVTQKILQTIYFNNFNNYNLSILPSYTQIINNDYYYLYNFNINTNLNFKLKTKSSNLSKKLKIRKLPMH